MKQAKDWEYRDLLHREHPTSPRHPRMSQADRAAQFAPFAALTGYEDAIGETARLTENEITRGEDLRESLDLKQSILSQLLMHRPEVSVTYFVSDERKSGGAYRTVTGRLKRIDEEERCLLLEDGTRILAERILEINSPCLAVLE